jgi:branched-chain amino acid transport system permease protein
MSVIESVTNTGWIKRIGLLFIALIIISLPTWGGTYLTTIMIFIGLDTLLVSGVCFAMGYAGLVPLGQAGFYGVGAYTSAILSTRYNISPWLGLAAAGIFTGALAYVIGKPLLKLHTHLLALATMVINMILVTLFIQLDFLTGGVNGLGGIPPFSIGGLVLDKDIHIYYLIWVMVAIMLAILTNIINSKVGRGIMAVHPFLGGNKTAAECLGIDAAHINNVVFVLSAVWAGIAGSIYAHYLTHINPQPFEVWPSIQFLMMAVVGGIASVWGGLIGASFFRGLKVLITLAVASIAPGTSAEYEVVIFALIFILVLLFSPWGIAHVPSFLRQWLSDKRRARGYP